MADEGDDPVGFDPDADEDDTLRRWEDKCAGMPAMTPGEIDAVAEVLRRIDSRRAQPRE